MSATVIVNRRTVVHKGSGGSAPGLPDFCKTPAPPGPPVPVPYPIVAQSSDTANGSNTVTCDGNPIMLKDSDFNRCSGDEPGTLKGVASSTNLGKAKFSVYSFDVKVEGKNVPRLGDAMTNNGNSPNTATVAELQAAAMIGEALTQLANACDDAVNKQWDNDHPKGPRHNDCTSNAGTGRLIRDRRTGKMVPEPVQVALGRLKEDCVNSLVPDSDHLKKQQAFDAAGNPADGPRTGGGIPDFIFHRPGGVTDIIAVYDLKFPCPSEARKPGRWSKKPDGTTQGDLYRRLFNVEPRLIFPV